MAAIAGAGSAGARTSVAGAPTTATPTTPASDRTIVGTAPACARTTGNISGAGAGLTVERARVEAAGQTLAARASTQRADETITLRFARPLPAGDALLELAFAGRLNQQLRGLYAASADGRRYAFSQCEAADARRIFPCFDEPAFKARFRLAVTVPDGLRAVSNSPIEAEHDGPDGPLIRFAPTPLLSTYLFALAVGPLEASAERRLGDVPIRIWHAPGKGHLTELGLEA